MEIPPISQAFRPDSPSSRPGHISKAAFFRAKSPANDVAQDRRLNALKSGWGAHPSDSSQSDESDDSHSFQQPFLPSLSASQGATAGHSPDLPQLPDDRALHRTMTQASYRSTSSQLAYDEPSQAHGNLGGSSSAVPLVHSNSRASSRLGQSGHRRTPSKARQLPPTPTPDAGFSRDPNELLMTLLAGQAAMDCQDMPVYRWEEVEDWKKELAMLSSRLASQVAKHQREQKILTAAKTLAKLNVGNKRMSKQTFESVEVAEQKAADAEKEMLVLRDRESSLRRTLMEHWAGVMAWEVRRLEYAVKAADDRALRAAHDAEELAQLREERRKAEILEQELGETRRLLEKGGNIIKQKEEEASLLKSELNSRDLKMSDLETALSELEGEVKTKRKEGALLEAEAGQHRTRASELENMLRGAEQHAVRVQEVERELSEIRLERETWAEEKSRLASAAEDSKMRANMWETAKIGTAQALGVQQVANIAEIVDGIKKLTVTVQHRDEELKVLKDEMREISVGFENEIGRIAKERDGYRAQLDDLGGRALNDETVRAKQTEELHSRLQSYTDKLMILESENASLKRALTEAEGVASRRKSIIPVPTSVADSEQAAQMKELRGQLDAQETILQSLWAMLPNAISRTETGLVDKSTDKLKSQIASPSVDIDFEALRTIYQSPPSITQGRYTHPQEIIHRIKLMLEDGQVLVERVMRAGRERELLKSNAARAQRLVEEGQVNLKTYQRQVDMLENRLKHSGGGTTNPDVTSKLDAAQRALAQSQKAYQQLERELAAQNEHVHRLAEANDILSQRALTLADEMDQDKRVAHAKLEKEIESLRKQLKVSDEKVDDERAREQTQRIQLLDELNSLQSEVTRLRAQLRGAH